MAEHTYPEDLTVAIGSALVAAAERHEVDAIIAAVSRAGQSQLGAAALDALVAATGGAAHVVRFERDRYTLQHPITERLDGTLFDCRLDQLIQQLPAAPAIGDFEVRAVDGQLVVGAPARTGETS